MDSLHLMDMAMSKLRLDKACLMVVDNRLNDGVCMATRGWEVSGGENIYAEACSVSPRN